MSVEPPDPATVERPWVASYPPGVPPTYQLPTVTLSRFLEDAARDFPTDDAISVDGATVDHAGLRDRSERVAGALAQHGIQAGDRVLVGVPNSHAAPVVLFALWRLGAVAVPVSPTTRADRLHEVVADADVVGVVATRRVLDALLDRVALPSVAVLADGNEWPRARRAERLRRLVAPRRFGPLRRVTDGPDVLKLADLAASEGPPMLPSGPRPDDAALLAYRPRGGDPRGVMLTHANLVANAFQARLWVPDIQAGRERVLVADGLHGVAALTVGLLTGILSGAAVILLDDPDGPTLARAIEAERPTLLATVPDRLRQLVGDGEVARRDLGSLRVVLALGEPLDPQVAAELERRSGGARVREGYGLAEACALTHAQPVYGKARPGTVGSPVTSTVAVVLDVETGRPCGPGEPGLLAVSGPQVASAYWRRDTDTGLTFTGGWVVTDDLVVADEDGVFRHVGRAAEIIQRQGTLVSPREVERALERHPEVAQAGVVADEDAGLLLAAVVARRRRPRPSPDDLLVHCRTHLDSPSVPDHVTLVDDLPHDEAGEVARDELRRDLAGR